MQADQKLYMHVFNKEGNRDKIRTREEIVSLFYNHIKAVNHIYENTNFGGITGLNFVIQRTTVSNFCVVNFCPFRHLNISDFTISPYCRFGNKLKLKLNLLQIYSNETCSGGRAAENSDNPFCEENVDVSNFLNINSQRNHSSFCLAYALTFRDFVGGTLGLAWVASPNYSECFHFFVDCCLKFR